MKIPAAAAITYRNPVIPGFYPDPSVCRRGSDFYLVTSSFEYFPGVPIFHSRDLVHWRQIGHVLTRSSQLDLRATKASGGIFAPTIRFHEGRFYVVTTDTTGIGNFLVQATDPAGPWSDPVRLPFGGIDPSFFMHEGRTWYTSNGLQWGRNGIYLAEMDLATGAAIGEPSFLWAGTGGKFPEGPHLYFREGWFYLLISEGGTEFGHMLTVARSRAVRGPYEANPRNPILTHRSTDHPTQATGHGDLVQDETGRWWVVFLGVRHSGYPQMHHLGRETCLAPVEWSEEGWPVIGDGKPLPLELPAPSVGGEWSAPAPLVRDDFVEGRLGLEWNFRRNPVEDAWSLTRAPGHLSLRCAAGSLDETAPMAFLGRRQQHFDARAETLLDFDPVDGGEEAGLAVQMNERHYAALVVTRRAGQRVVLARRRVGTLRAEGPAHALPEGRVGLRVRANESTYTLEVCLENGWTLLAEVETRHLSTELAGGFTGVYFALFASGNGAESSNWASFDWFDYEAAPDENFMRGVKSQTHQFYTGPKLE